MKKMIAIVAALFVVALAVPAFAQMYPGAADADFNNFLSKHPNEAAQLRSNPGLIDNQNWIHDHAALAQYLDNHPNVRKTIRAQSNGMRGPEPYAGRGPGDYDEHHQWHDANWWQQNNPAWWRAHHPDHADHHDADHHEEDHH